MHNQINMSSAFAILWYHNPKYFWTPPVGLWDRTITVSYYINSYRSRYHSAIINTKYKQSQMIDFKGFVSYIHPDEPTTSSCLEHSGCSGWQVMVLAYANAIVSAIQSDTCCFEAGQLAFFSSKHRNNWVAKAQCKCVVLRLSTRWGDQVNCLTDRIRIKCLR